MGADAIFFSIYNQMCKGSCVKFMNPVVNVRYGLVVRIPGSHPGGPGSIPGNGNPFYGRSVCPTEVSTSVMDRYLNRVPRRHRHMTERVNGIKIIDEDGIRTHACRAHWISSPTP